MARSPIVLGIAWSDNLPDGAEDSSGSSRPFQWELLEGRVMLAGQMSAIARVDAALPDQRMLAQALPDVYRIDYDSTRESAADVLDRAIGAAREQGCGIQSVLIISHGTPGEFELGNGVV